MKLVKHTFFNFINTLRWYSGTFFLNENLFLILCTKLCSTFKQYNVLKNYYQSFPKLIRSITSSMTSPIHLVLKILQYSLNFISA